MFKFKKGRLFTKIEHIMPKSPDAKVLPLMDDEEWEDYQKEQSGWKKIFNNYDK